MNQASSSILPFKRNEIAIPGLRKCFEKCENHSILCSSNHWYEKKTGIPLSIHSHRDPLLSGNCVWRTAVLRTNEGEVTVNRIMKKISEGRHPDFRLLKEEKLVWTRRRWRR